MLRWTITRPACESVKGRWLRRCMIDQNLWRWEKRRSWYAWRSRTGHIGVVLELRLSWRRIRRSRRRVALARRGIRQVVSATRTSTRVLSRRPKWIGIVSMSRRSPCGQRRGRRRINRNWRRIFTRTASLSIGSTKFRTRSQNRRGRCRTLGFMNCLGWLLLLGRSWPRDVWASRDS